MIKVLGIDIYGTVLATDDYENEYSKRKGFNELVKYIKSKGIKLVSCSDSYPVNVKIDLKESGVDLGIFDGFYELKTKPKDFSSIIADYSINPEEFLIVGDNYEKDIMGAKKMGSEYIHVPEYKISENKTNLFEILMKNKNFHPL